MSNETIEQKLSEGWDWMFNARKWHWFSRETGRSICGNWLRFDIATAPLKPDTGPSKDDCTACRRKLDARKKHGSFAL